MKKQEKVKLIQEARESWLEADIQEKYKYFYLHGYLTGELKRPNNKMSYKDYYELMYKLMMED